MRLMRRWLLIVPICAVMLTACDIPPLLSTPQRPHTLPDAQQIFRPIREGIPAGDLYSLDPAVDDFSTSNLLSLVFPSLVTIDEHNGVAPWAATSWKTSADGLTWTFHLRSGMRWSDAEPIDASTFAYAINRALDPCTTGGYYQGELVYGPHAGVTDEVLKGSLAFAMAECPPGQAASSTSLLGTALVSPDPLTLVFVLSHPASYFLLALTIQAALATPRQLIERYGRGDPLWHQPGARSRVD